MANHREQLPARIAVVTFAAPQVLARFEPDLGLGLPMFADRDRELDAALGRERGSVARAWLDPGCDYDTRGSWPLASACAGRRRTRFSSAGTRWSTSRLRLAWVYRSNGPEDRPAIEVPRGALEA